MTAWITTAASVLVAVGAGLLTYRNARRLQQRQAQLERVNAQLGELYGPLLALAATSETAWRAFRGVFRPGSFFAVSGQDLTDEERAAWVRWMKIVFMPNNLRAYELIVTKAHLLMGQDVPKCLLDLCAHVAGYQVVVDHWENGDYSRLTSFIDHPRGAYLDYVAESVVELKKRQQELLALVKPR